MSSRRDFLRNTFMAIAATLLPKTLLPSAPEVMDEASAAWLKLQHAISKTVPPGKFILFEKGVFTTSDYDTIQFLETSPHGYKNLPDFLKPQENGKAD